VESDVTIVDGVRLVSNSEVQTYKDCPRRWWLAWYRGLTQRTADVQSPAATGNRIHAALAAYYVPDGETAADPLRTLEQAQREDLAAFEAQIPTSFDDGDWPGSDKVWELEHLSLRSQFDLEHAMISGYMEWIVETGVDVELEVIQSEAYVEAIFVRPTWSVKLIGKLDARVIHRVTGRRKFIDHKTVGSLHDPVLGLNQQMLHYQLIEFLNTDEGQVRCDGALYNMLRKVKRTRASKPPYYARVPIDHNIHELTNYQKQLTHAINALESASLALDLKVEHHLVVPARPSRDCVWKCQFFRICRMFDDGSRVEDAVEALYEKRDPLSYYGGRHLDHE
jgi:RecB family exonuclease